MNKLALSLTLALAAALAALAQLPKSIPGGYDLPNGWRITPVGRAINTEDLVTNVTLAPDGKSMIALHSGFNPHGLVVIDTASQEAVQRLGLKSGWFGLAWSPDGKQLFVSGGNSAGRRPTRAPIHIFDYAGGKLSAQPVATLEDTETDMRATYWSGVAHHPTKPVIFAADKGTASNPGYIAVFDTATRKLTARIPVEVSPYDLVLSPTGDLLYVSNWSSDTVSVIDTAKLAVVSSIPVGDNPNDLELAADGRLFVACANDNTVHVIDTKTRLVTERINTALFPRAPEGSTPNALVLDRPANRLFVANADNNSVAVVDVAKPGRAEVLGFIPAGWYPSALSIDPKRARLYIGNSKGLGSYPDPLGPHSPLPGENRGSVKSLQKGSINIVEMAAIKTNLRAWTKQVYDNSPYSDQLLVKARAPKEATVIPSAVGQASPIKHVIYVIRENRTYDQVLGDLPKGNGDARITIFGRDVTPNAHALSEQFVTLDNLYCDGEVSVDGHSWSNAAYATDFNEKLWPPNYGGHSNAGPAPAYVPASGHIWDQALRKGLTVRSYGEYVGFNKELGIMTAIPRVPGLVGNVAPNFKKPGMRDTDNVREFIREFDEYEKNYDSKDPAVRLPNFLVMSLPEDHTNGTTPGRNTPRAMVANNDYAVGMLVQRVTHSKYWPETAIFVIEDDAQDGSDHVDARRTVGLVISPYIKRGTLDSTLYTTSSFLRTMELILGVQPMSQFDAAANPLYASFGTKPDLTPYKVIEPKIDVDEKNTARAYGARESQQMDFSDVDLTPMRELNEIIWKSIRGADSEMPTPVRRLIFPSGE